MLLFLFSFFTRNTYSAGYDRTHVACASATTCAEGPTLYSTFVLSLRPQLNFLLTVFTGPESDLRSHCGQTCDQSAIPLFLSLVLDLRPVQCYSVCPLPSSLRAHPGDGTARRVRWVYALYSSGTVLVTDLRPASSLFSPPPSASELSPSPLLYRSPFFCPVNAFLLRSLPFLRCDCTDRFCSFHHSRTPYTRCTATLP